MIWMTLYLFREGVDDLSERLTVCQFAVVRSA